MEKIILKIYLFISTLLVAFTIDAQEPVIVNPKAVGLSAERLSRIDTLMNKFIRDEKLPGMVALIARHGKIAYYKSFGRMDIEANKTMQKDAIFRIASMTKAITSVAVMTLYEEGRGSYKTATDTTALSS